MKALKIAMLQALPGQTTEENLQKGLELCREARLMGADIALFPEMWSTGYSIPDNMEELAALALPVSSSFVGTFAALAKELEMAIGITFLEKHNTGPRNTLCLFDRFGENALTYAKVHTCDFGEEAVLTPGDSFPVCSLDTAAGAVRVGAMICYDREFPESARILMLGGAEVILVPNACPMEINRLSQLRARAYENMVGIVTVNYPAGQPDCNGHSSAFDGIAYRPSGGGPRDTLIIEAGEDEGIYMANVPVAAIRQYRECEVHGNAYRRPGLYGPLVSDAVAPPFVREDARRS